MQKIGIITLHKVLNYGSALQAYALQTYIEQNYNAEVELINYIYPNKYHQQYIENSYIGIIRSILRKILKENLIEKKYVKKKKFEDFYNRYFHLSNRTYKSVAEIENTPPIYDLYITGSDQVWNVNTLYNDPVFYITFAPSNARRISFGASFAIRQLPDTVEDSIRNRLNKYSYIGVREFSSLDILNDLGLHPDITYKNTCDPTLLLNSKEYDKLAAKSTLQIEGDYILVYQLEYAFDAEPSISRNVNVARKYFGCPIIMIDNCKRRLKKRDKHFYGLGPIDWIWLFKHAKAIITSSFHGTMFSIIYRKPFVTIAPSPKHADKRISDILHVVDLENHIIYNEQDSPTYDWSQPFWKSDDMALRKYIKSSKDFLNLAITQNLAL